MIGLVVLGFYLAGVVLTALSIETLARVMGLSMSPGKWAFFVGGCEALGLDPIPKETRTEYERPHVPTHTDRSWPDECLLFPNGVRRRRGY